MKEMKDIKNIRVFNDSNGGYIQLVYLDENGRLHNENLDTKSGIREIINFVNENDVLSIDELLNTVSFYNYDANNDHFKELSRDNALDSYSEFLTAIMSQKVIDMDSDVKDNTDNLELAEINYYKYGNEYLARFVYSDGTYKLLGLHDANNYLEVLIKDGAIDKDFVNNNIHFYRTVDDDNYIEVDFDDYKSHYTTLDINNVVLNHVEDGEDYLTIIFNNGNTEEVSANHLDDIINEYSKLTGMSVTDLFDRHFIVENNIASDEEEIDIEDNIEEDVADDEEIVNANEDVNDVDNELTSKEEKPSLFSRIKNFFKRDKEEELEDEEELEEAPKKTIFGRIKGLIKKHPKIIALALAGIIGFIGYKIYNYFNIGENTNITQQTDDEFENSDYATIVDESRNTERVDALSKIHNYMVRHYVDGIKNRDADIEFEPNANDIMAYYLAYNNLDQETIDKIYGDEKIDYKSMKIAIKNLVKHDAIDHTMQKNSLGKDIILNDSDASTLYNKLENIFIQINKTDSENKKIELLTRFNDKVRETLPNMTTKSTVTPSTSQSYDGVAAYMYMIREFYLAADKYNLDVDNSLTYEEKAYIDGIYDKIIEPKLIDIASKHNNEYDSSEELDGPSYSLFMEKIQDDYIALFNNLYIPDEVEDEEKEEKMDAMEDSIITAEVANDTKASNTNNSSSYSGSSSVAASNATTASATGASENSDPEEENIYDEGYNKQKDSKKSSKKKQKAKDVKIRKETKDEEDIEDIEDVEINDTIVDVDTTEVEDIADVVSDDVVADEVVQDVEIEDTSVQDTTIEDVQEEDVVIDDVQGVDVETVETVEDVVLEVNEDEDVNVVDTVIDNNISDVEVTDAVDDVVVLDTTEVIEEVAEDTILDTTEDEEDVLSAEEIADTIVEIMASDDVEDIEIEDDYQYTR